jgi:nitrogen fixation protein NifU and related proteins
VNEELRDLYQEVILDHSKSPRNYREMENPDRTVEGFNPLCGDKITLYVKLEDGKVADASFQGIGCAISTASASMLTEAIKGKSEDQVDELFEAFHHMVTGEDPVDAPCDDCLGKLAVFAGIREFPMRIKCATLCWHALQSALKEKGNTVTTE